MRDHKYVAFPSRAPSIIGVRTSNDCRCNIHHQRPDVAGSGPVNLRIQRLLKYTVMSDAMFATMAKVEGKDFELNEATRSWIGES